MSFCAGCHQPINFRYIDGRCVPLGCACYSGARPAFRGTRVVPSEPWLSGLGVVPWPVTYVTRCFWCPDLVYYHTNGYGDCVLFDELGPPWPVHRCWTEHCAERRRAVVTCTVAIRRLGVENLYEDGDGPSIGESVEAGAWWRPSAYDDPRQWLRLLREKLVYTVQAPPVEPDMDNPGPFLVMGWVISRADEVYATAGMTRTLVELRLGVRNLTVFVPEGVARQFRVGDAFIGDIIAYCRGHDLVYVATKVRLPNGASVSIPVNHPGNVTQ
jgi:hypothetical protein